MSLLKTWISVLTLGCMLVLFACEVPVDWELQPEGTGQLVVDAILTDELKFQQLMLTESYPDPNGQPPPVSGAQVWVETDSELYPFREDADTPGLYRSEQAFAGVFNTTYSLVIEWGGKRYEAREQLARVLPFVPFEFQRVGQTAFFQIANPPNLFSPHEQAMYQVDIEWPQEGSVEARRAQLRYFTFSTVDVPEVFRPEQERVVFPAGSVVRVRKYGLSPEFAEFFRALMLETTWQGGPFDEASGLIPSNVDGGALGFFGVCAVRERVQVVAP